MSAPDMEAFLARLYVDKAAREAFLDDPRGEAARAGLNEEECQAMEEIDRVGLDLAARSIARKRRGHRAQRVKPLP